MERVHSPGEFTEAGVGGLARAAICMAVLVPTLAQSGWPASRKFSEDAHGGRVTVESELGAGSNFRVALPAPERIRG